MVQTSFVYGLLLWIIQRMYVFQMLSSNKYLKYIVKFVIHSASYTVILADFHPVNDRVEFKDLREVDQYMYMKLQEVIKTVRAAYDRYDFATVYHVVNNFVSSELSSFYLDIAKDVVYIYGT